MFPGGKGNQDLMKMAQKMSKDLQSAQEDLQNRVVETTAGGGMIKVKMNGKHEVLSISIEEEVVDPDDVEMLEDLLMAAINDANDKISKDSASEMSKLTGGLKIPGLT
ncbi:MAG: YbaB/EbfC family nucleoid-associated protein [Candidatus Cloacimonadota bacterium]|nr:YbaB/EbfC family nucleoid-associated protein [Candidatus Cloacimonadota bacterium]